MPADIVSAGGVRVLHLTTSHFADDTRIFDKECRSLAAAGYVVTLAGAGAVPPGSPVRHRPLPPRDDRRSRRLLSGIATGLSISRSEWFDILHLHDPELLPVGVMAARAGRAVIWDAHEDYVSRFTGDAGDRERLGRLSVAAPVRGLLRSMDARAAGVVAATPSIASGYRNRRTVVVGNEARLEHFMHATPIAGNRQLLFTGAASAYHLFPAIVEAVVRVPRISLAVAGRTLPPDVLAFARTRLGERLRLLGWLDRKQLVAAMSDSLLGFATLEDTPIGQDNSSNKVFEFAAAGLPALMSPNPSNRRHAQGGHAYVATGFTSEAIEKAILEALSDDEVWRQKSRRGRIWARERGSWTLSEGVLLDLYAEIAADVGRTGRVPSRSQRR